MSMEFPRAPHEATEPLSRRYIVENNRRVALLDLIRGDDIGETPLLREGNVNIAPESASHLLRRTDVGQLFASPGEPLTPLVIVDLYQPKANDMPRATSVPDRVFWRATDWREAMEWRATYGIGFEYRIVNPYDEVFTLQEDVGLAIGPNGITVYRQVFVFYDDVPILEEPDLVEYKAPVRVIDQFTYNMTTLSTPFQQEFFDINMPGTDGLNGETTD